MKNFLKGKVATVIILIATFVLAGVAIFTAIRLFQLRQGSVAPTAPESKPAAAGNSTTSCNALIFTISSSPAPITCNQGCGAVSGTSCQTGLTCYQSDPNVIGSNVCRNPQCPSQTDCTCPGATATPTPTPTATPTGAPNSCGGTCGSNSNCNNDLVCSSGFCRNPNCTGNANCVCGTATPTPTGTARPIATITPVPTAAPALDNAGTDWPSVLGIIVGTVTIIGSLILAL